MAKIARFRQSANHEIESPLHVAPDAIAKTAAAATTAMNVFDSSASPGVSWPVGCFNRPWMQKFGAAPQPSSTPQPANWGLDTALAGIKEAGYLDDGPVDFACQKASHFLGGDSETDYLPGLKKRIAGAGLTATMGALRINFEASPEDIVKQVRLKRRSIARPVPELGMAAHLRLRQGRGQRKVLPRDGRRRRLRAGTQSQTGAQAPRRRQRRLRGNSAVPQRNQPSQFQNLV